MIPRKREAKKINKPCLLRASVHDDRQVHTSLMMQTTPKDHWHPVTVIFFEPAPLGIINGKACPMLPIGTFFSWFQLYVWQCSSSLLATPLADSGFSQSKSPVSPKPGRNQPWLLVSNNESVSGLWNGHSTIRTTSVRRVSAAAVRALAKGAEAEADTPDRRKQAVLQKAFCEEHLRDPAGGLVCCSDTTLDHLWVGAVTRYYWDNKVPFGLQETLQIPFPLDDQHSSSNVSGNLTGIFWGRRRIFALKCKCILIWPEPGCSAESLTFIYSRVLEQF